MSEAQGDVTDRTTVQKIIRALRSCYGPLDDPTSVVGRFAVLRHPAADGGCRWVVGPDDAPTPLAALVATAVQAAGLQLLDRATVMRRIRMQRADGSDEATLYQASFTDTDRIP